MLREIYDNSYQTTASTDIAVTTGASGSMELSIALALKPSSIYPIVWDNISGQSQPYIPVPLKGNLSSPVPYINNNDNNIYIDSVLFSLSELAGVRKRTEGSMLSFIIGELRHDSASFSIGRKYFNSVAEFDEFIPLNGKVNLTNSIDGNIFIFYMLDPSMIDFPYPLTLFFDGNFITDEMLPLASSLIARVRIAEADA